MEGGARLLILRIDRESASTASNANDDDDDDDVP